MFLIKKKLEKIREWLSTNKLDAYIIPHDDEYLSEYVPPENERLEWISGFTGSAGYSIITQDKAAIFVDGRYTVQVKDQVDSTIFNILNIPNDSWIVWLVKNCKTQSKIGYDSRLFRVNWKKQFKKQLNPNKKQY